MSCILTRIVGAPHYNFSAQPRGDVVKPITGYWAYFRKTAVKKKLFQNSDLRGFFNSLSSAMTKKRALLTVLNPVLLHKLLRPYFRVFSVSELEKDGIFEK